MESKQVQEIVVRAKTNKNVRDCQFDGSKRKRIVTGYPFNREKYSENGWLLPEEPESPTPQDHIKHLITSHRMNIINNGFKLGIYWFPSIKI